MNSPIYPRRILAQNKDRLLPILVSDIVCFYSTDKGATIFLKNGEIHFIPKSLDSIIKTLDPMEFCRANKQYIVAKSAISNLIVWYDSRLLVHVEVEIPEPMYVAKNRASEFKQWMCL